MVKVDCAAQIIVSGQITKIINQCAVNIVKRGLYVCLRLLVWLGDIAQCVVDARRTVALYYFLHACTCEHETSGIDTLHAVGGIIGYCGYPCKCLNLRCKVAR